MVKEVAQDIFLIEVPLPNSPLKNLNSHFIRGDSRNLLIDTGFNRDACFEALHAGLSELNANMDKTDIFLTHLHADHCGLCQRIASEHSKIYMSTQDRQILLELQDDTARKSMRSTFSANGVPEDILDENMRTNPAFTCIPQGNFAYTAVDEDTVFDLGSYRLQVVFTPGHTPGHCCLFDKNKKILFSGDHVIFGISPNIMAWEGVADSLGDYIDSLKKIYPLDVATTFSAHRNSMGDCRARIDDLIAHHDLRLKETYEIVKARPNSNAYEVASLMTWSIRAKNWAEFPTTQKWFATGEALSHLEHLFHKKSISKSNVGGIFVYNTLD